MPALHDEVTLKPLCSGASPSQTTLVFFIPGNPGLISYYDDCLSHLADLLASMRPKRKSGTESTKYMVYGASMAGFDLHPGRSSRRAIKTTSHVPPLSLDGQVDDVYARLDLVTRQLNETGDDISIILIGHSIGAYIAMQIVQRWQNTSHLSLLGSRIISSIGLFPTIYELAQSPTGQKVGPLTKIPGFAFAVQCLAKLLFSLVPISLVTMLVGLITGMSHEPATVTAEFVKSPHGVRQALHMAKDELAQLTHDQWDDDFWQGRAARALSKPAAGVSEPVAGDDETPHTQLYFYWGADDHWIANTTRDNIIAKRAQTVSDPESAGKPIMEIDKHGIPHAFCLKQTHSRLTAAKCAEWILDVEERRHA